MVRNALGLDVAGRRGSMTYLEGVMAIHPDLMMGLNEQQYRAGDRSQFFNPGRGQDSEAIGSDYDQRPGAVTSADTFESNT